MGQGLSLDLEFSTLSRLVSQPQGWPSCAKIISAHHQVFHRCHGGRTQVLMLVGQEICGVDNHPNPKI